VAFRFNPRYFPYELEPVVGVCDLQHRPPDRFLYTERVIPNISAKDEYLRYRNVLKDRLLLRKELRGLDIKCLLQARESGLALLKSRINQQIPSTLGKTLANSEEDGINNS
jgi:hypothetical protein